MIAVAFLIVLIVVFGALALTGAVSVKAVAQLGLLTLLFLAFFLSGVYVAAALGLLGLIVDLAFSVRPLHSFFGQIAWNTSINFLFVAVPLFLLMGELLLRSGLSDRMYRALNLWFGTLPGGLLHTNIASSALFSAVSGSSVATAATIGAVALPYFRDTSYKPRLVLGSLAAGGALGNLIPPGISIIVYALLTDTSVGKLYAAALVAGVLMTVLFMLYILLVSLRSGSTGEEMRVDWPGRLASLVDLVPTMLLMVLVLGTLYMGLATATEAAALGVVGALALALAYGRFSRRMLLASLRATAQSTSMIGLILFGAYILNYVLSSLRLPQTLAGMVSGLPFPPVVIIAVIIAFYLALGTFMESLSMMITTLPIVFPIVMALGYDPVWFGVIMVMLLEAGLISPPDGMVMYVLQGLRDPPGPISDVFMGVLPFLGLYIFGIVVLTAFPGAILWIVR
jgi:tripartite ATP-independent transporter DctM subunit